MKFLSLVFVLLAAFAVITLAEPKPEPAKAYRLLHSDHMEEDNIKEANNQNNDFDQLDTNEDSSKKVDTSSGRLFMKKFSFKNMFGQNQNQKQPIIPIIITGVGSPTTSTFTSEGTIPTASGTITTEPLPPTTNAGDSSTGGGADTGAGTGAGADTGTGANTGAGANNGAGAGGNRILLYGRDHFEENDKETEEDDDAVDDEQALAAIFDSKAQEYIVTDQNVKASAEAKANRSPARINLRRRGATRGQVISVRIPAKYQGYFKNGQRVMFSSNNRSRPGKRRVIKRRNNRRRGNKNKRRRIVAS